jgi:hypothetical protein
MSEFTAHSNFQNVPHCLMLPALSPLSSLFYLSVMDLAPFSVEQEIPQLLAVHPYSVVNELLLNMLITKWP